MKRRVAAAISRGRHHSLGLAAIRSSFATLPQPRKSRSTSPGPRPASARETRGRPRGAGGGRRKLPASAMSFVLTARALNRLGALTPGGERTTRSSRSQEALEAARRAQDGASESEAIFSTWARFSTPSGA
jgi:hypothetical protein